ncbi:hypothetical protein X749_24840 [Mesorhizobium sp. LNJC391B00]|nr:hypothetical protein X749_24840 [Mesorhizobium sp. LNJC391B00]
MKGRTGSGRKGRHPYCIRQFFPLIAIRLAFACARSVLGNVTVSTPFLKAALTLSSSTS